MRRKETECKVKRRKKKVCRDRRRQMNIPIRATAYQLLIACGIDLRKTNA